MVVSPLGLSMERSKPDSAQADRLALAVMLLAANITQVELSEGAHVLLMPMGLLLPIDKAATALASMKPVIQLLPVTTHGTLTLAVWHTQRANPEEGWLDLYKEAFKERMNVVIRSRSIEVRLSNAEALTLFTTYDLLSGSISLNEERVTDGSVPLFHLLGGPNGEDRPRGRSRE